VAIIWATTGLELETTEGANLLVQALTTGHPFDSMGMRNSLKSLLPTKHHVIRWQFMSRALHLYYFLYRNKKHVTLVLHVTDYTIWIGVHLMGAVMLRTQVILITIIIIFWSLALPCMIVIYVDLLPSTTFICLASHLKAFKPLPS